ncbi:MAG: ABC transporter permease, partial [Erysipelotrichaceae bacterium]|nr:ABC transporter permease [Erysipelotrichaceae bacterium]
MFKYILKRIGLMLMTFFIITTICFVLVKMLPSLPAEQFGKDMALIMQRRELLGYNLPIMVQYARFWKYAFRGNFGISEVLYIGQEVWKVFVQKLPYTVAVNVYSILFSIPLGIGLGIFAALKKNTWIDHVISTGVMIVVSVPSFIYAFLVQYILYFKLGIASATMDTSMGAFSWV